MKRLSLTQGGQSSPESTGYTGLPWKTVYKGQRLFAKPRVLSAARCSRWKDTDHSAGLEPIKTKELAPGADTADYSAALWLAPSQAVQASTAETVKGPGDER